MCGALRALGVRLEAFEAKSLALQVPPFPRKAGGHEMQLNGRNAAAARDDAA